MSGEAVFAIWLLLCGAAGGSFVTALADRLLSGRDPWRAPSACAACGVRIGWRDLVPLWSWVALRGRCRSCGAAIPARVLGGEVAGVLAAATALWVVDGVAAQIAGTVFLVLLVGLFLTDFAAFRLPDALTFPLALAGTWSGALAFGWVPALVAGVAGAGALWLVAAAYRRWRAREGLGLGDLKMMAGLSAAVGPLGIPWLTLVAAATALLVALWQGRTQGDRAIPFGCYLAVAGALVWIATRLGAL